MIIMNTFTNERESIFCTALYGYKGGCDAKSTKSVGLFYKVPKNCRANLDIFSTECTTSILASPNAYTACSPRSNKTCRIKMSTKKLNQKTA